VWPVVGELHRKGRGARATPEELTGALYDALSLAYSEIKPQTLLEADPLSALRWAGLRR
jgi:hypothetical protein